MPDRPLLKGSYENYVLAFLSLAGIDFEREFQWVFFFASLSLFI
jgi:hypothetical protein